MLSALRNFALTFAISALIFGIIAYFVAGFVLDTMSDIGTETREDDNIDLDIIPTDTTEGEGTSELPPADEEITGDSFNVLFIGSDYQSAFKHEYSVESIYDSDELPDLRNRKWTADTLLVMRVDKEHRKFTFCSVPSNMQVIVDGMTVKLGDILPEKGEAELAKYVTGRTGLKINYYVHIDLDTFTDFVSVMTGKIGGFSYSAPIDMFYEDPEQDLYINIAKGQNINTPDEAIQLLRFNSYPSGTHTRASVTVDFMQAMFKAYTSSPKTLDTYLELYSLLVNKSESNITKNDIIHNLDLLLSYNKFTSEAVTYPGKEIVSGGEIYFIPDTSAVSSLFD